MMVRIGYFFVFAVSFVLVSCNVSNVRWGAEKWDYVEEINLQGEQIIINKPVYTEDEWIFHNGYVIFGNLDGQRQFSIYKSSADSLNFIGSFYTLGRGPNETLAAEAFYLQEDGLLAIVGYNPRGKSFFIPLDNIENCMDVNTWRSSEYEYVSSYAFDMIPINDSIYVAQTFDDDNQLIKVVDVCSGKVFQTNISYPDDDNDNLLMSEKSMLYAGDVRKQPSANRYVYSNMSSKYSIIFTLSEDDFNVVDRRVIFDQIPRAYSQGDRLIYTNNHESGYQLSVSDKFIYYADPKINYNEREKSISINGYPPGYVTDIYVSDWDGNPQYKLILDRPVCYLQPDADDSFLWAFFFDSDSLEPQIVRYVLPKI